MSEDFQGNLTDVWYGNEIEISVGYYDSEVDSGKWIYEVIEYREGFNPDMPEQSEGIYDKLSYKGDKRIQVENSISLSQKFTGFGVGLDKFENLNGLVAKAVIVPDGGSIPGGVDSERYYTNFSPSNSDLDEVPNEGSFNNNLSGRFDQKVEQEPAGALGQIVGEEIDATSLDLTSTNEIVFNLNGVEITLDRNNYADVEDIAGDINQLLTASSVDEVVASDRGDSLVITGSSKSDVVEIGEATSGSLATIGLTHGEYAASEWAIDHTNTFN